VWNSRWKGKRIPLGSEWGKCLLCNRWSFMPICSHCFRELETPPKLHPAGYFYFYRYEEIALLLKYKYHPLGSGPLKLLARATFGNFPKFYKSEKIYSIPIDPVPERGFSHTAIFATALPFPSIFGLYATGQVKYAGRSKEFRLNNPRNFIYTGKRGIKGILVDDLITTGTTFREATTVLEQAGVEVLFGVFLATDQI